MKNTFWTWIFETIAVAALLGLLPVLITIYYIAFGGTI